MNCPVCGSERKPEYKKCPTCGVDFAVWLDKFIKKLNKKTDTAINQAKKRKNETRGLNSKTEKPSRYTEVIKQTAKKKKQ